MAEQMVEDESSSFLPAASSSSLTNGGGNVLNSSSVMEAAAIAANLSTGLSTSDAKAILSSILGANSQNNLQVLSMAAAANSGTQRVSSSLKPAPSPGHPSTTPTRVTTIGTRKRGRPPTIDQDDSVKRKKGAGASGAGAVNGAPTNKGGNSAASEKHNKGLRHFSQLVCEKVREKGVTTYNEVADELVKELSEAERKVGQDGQIDQKNIRRRVYDALNVLMAMNIINKEKKEIRWIGLPTNSVQECEHIQMELSQQEERISKKTAELHEIILQIITLKNLIKRNRERAEMGDSPSQHSAIGLPFILVNTSKQTVIDCSISSDKSEYVFTFDNTFELHQDVDILNKMDLDCGLHSGKITPQSLAEAKSMLPKVFESVVDEIALISQTIPQSPTPAVSSDGPSSTVTSTPTSLTHTAATAPPPVSLTPLSNEQHTNGGAGGGISSTPIADSIQPLVPSNEQPDDGTGTVPLSNSLAMAAATFANSHNPVTVAAAISTLQQLQQSSNDSPSLLPPPTSPFRTGTVTARPLNFTSPARLPPPPPPSSIGSPLLVKGQQQPSPKVVTVQPLPSVTSRMAEMIASLQSSILIQQQQLVAAASATSQHQGGGGENTAPNNELQLANKGEHQPSSEEVEQLASFLTPSSTFNT